MAVEKLIVDHIDTWTTALQTRSTAGRGSSGKIDLYGIKKLRELILELAVRGKLVPQDRTMNRRRCCWSVSQRKKPSW